MDEDKSLIDLEIMKNSFPYKNIDWSQFKFWKKILPNNTKEFIYDFGEPIGYPLCRFAIFYVDHLNGIYEYITLEKTLDYQRYPFVVCGQKGKQHKNYSIECSGNLDIFENVVLKIIGDKLNQ